MTLDDLISLLRRANRDERAAISYVVGRVMGIGRENYGPLVIRNDARDFRKERADELADWLWYAAIEEVKAYASPRRSSIDLVREFHERFGQAIADAPHLDDRDLSALRVSLLAEELEELRVALSNRDPVAVLDALTDLQYVLDGAYLSLGFHRYKDSALAEVHRSNMSKLGADGKPALRADGKILKGPSYSPPDLVAVLQDNEPTGERPTLDEHKARFEGEFGEAFPLPPAPIVAGPHALIDSLFDDGGTEP